MCDVRRAQSGEMLFGAPGTYNWRGNLFSNILDDGLHVIARWRQSPVEDARPGTAMPRPATSFYSYLGLITFRLIADTRADSKLRPPSRCAVRGAYLPISIVGENLGGSDTVGSIV